MFFFSSEAKTSSLLSGLFVGLEAAKLLAQTLLDVGLPVTDESAEIVLESGFPVAENCKFVASN